VREVVVALGDGQSFLGKDRNIRPLEGDAPLGGRPPNGSRLGMTSAQKMRVVGGVAFCVALVGSMFSSALPSPLGAKIALVAATVAGAYSAWEAKPGGKFSPENEQADTTYRDSFIIRHAILRVPLLGLMMAFFVYMAVGCGAFWLITEVIGHRETLAFIITGSGSSRRSCQHINVEEAGFVPDRALCATDELMYGAIPGRTVYLSGKMSVLGLNVENISYTPPK
jgi:hypothetical protein